MVILPVSSPSTSLPTTRPQIYFSFYLLSFIFFAPLFQASWILASGPPHQPPCLHHPPSLFSTWPEELFYSMDWLVALCILQGFSSLTRDCTWASAVKEPSPNHWATREFPRGDFVKGKSEHVTLLPKTSKGFSYFRRSGSYLPPQNPSLQSMILPTD